MNFLHDQHVSRKMGIGWKDKQHSICILLVIASDAHCHRSTPVMDEVYVQMFRFGCPLVSDWMDSDSRSSLV